MTEITGPGSARPGRPARARRRNGVRCGGRSTHDHPTGAGRQLAGEAASSSAVFPDPGAEKHIQHQQPGGQAKRSRLRCPRWRRCGQQVGAELDGGGGLAGKEQWEHNGPVEQCFPVWTG